MFVLNLPICNSVIFKIIWEATSRSFITRAMLRLNSSLSKQYYASNITFYVKKIVKWEKSIKKYLYKKELSSKKIAKNPFSYSVMCIYIYLKRTLIHTQSTRIKKPHKRFIFRDLCGFLNLGVAGKSSTDVIDQRV